MCSAQFPYRELEYLASVVGYRGKNIKGKPKSRATYMQDSFLERLYNVKSICFFLPPQNHLSLPFKKKKS